MPRGRLSAKRWYAGSCGMRGARLIPAAAAAVTARRIASWLPRVIAYTLRGYSSTGGRRRTRASELQVGEERTLSGRGRRPATARLRVFLARVLLARGLLRPFTLGPRPTLLVRNLV